MTSTTEKCPYCGQNIAHSKLEEIRRRIRKEEEERLAALRKTHEQELAAQQKAFRDDLRKEKEKAFERVRSKEQDLLEKEEKLKAMRKTLQGEKDDLRKELEGQYSERLKREKEKLGELAEKKASDFKEQAEKANAKATRLEKEIVKKVEEGKTLAREEFDRDKRKMQRQIEELSGQLEKKTSEELGSMSEEELMALLKSNFPEDSIKRVPKGEIGADIKHEIMDRGIKCGLIIYESKNVKNWLNEFWDRAKKFRSMYETRHIVIVSTAFPGKEKELFVKDDIIVVHPARAIYVVRLIRDSILQLRGVSLSNEAQDSKIQEVYRYLSGQDFKVQMKDVFAGVDDLRKILTEERSKHETWWTKQTEKHQIIQNAATKVQTRISRIIESSD